MKHSMTLNRTAVVIVQTLSQIFSFPRFQRIAISIELLVMRMFLTDKSEKIGNDFAILTLLYLLSIFERQSSHV